jgi:hypothetical protein
VARAHLACALGQIRKQDVHDAEVPTSTRATVPDSSLPIHTVRVGCSVPLAQTPPQAAPAGTPQSIDGGLVPRSAARAG